MSKRFTLPFSTEQDRIFNEYTGKRKVILSTNIAESSITLPDVGYVIDTCLVKELHVDSESNHQSLILNWCSRASLDQVFRYLTVVEIRTYR
jgi:HrpA-like RNA helicase